MVGREFPVRVVERVAEVDDVLDDLAVLLRAQVIREHRRYPELECVFRHGLLRDAAFSTITPARAKELFRRVAAAFEELYADSLEEHLERLAFYYYRSDEYAKALRYLERAGARAASLNATAHAEELFARARRVASKMEAPKRSEGSMPC